MLNFAKVLLLVTILYNVVEGVIALWSGIVAGSIALVLVPWLVREGLEGIKGEEHHDELRLCSCRSCLFGLRNCAAVCCVA